MTIDLDHFNNDELARAGTRLKRLSFLTLATTALCFVAGIWADWRWLPTSLVPGALAVVFVYAESATRAEAIRRLTAAKTTAISGEARS